MTQYTEAVDGVITPEMLFVAQREGVDPERIRDEVAAGRLVIPANRIHLDPPGAESEGVLEPRGIGRVVSTKINANIGVSSDKSCEEEELIKLRWAVRYGADAVMDLSTGGDTDRIRAFLISRATVPFGTVPIYAATADAPVEELTVDDMLETCRRQARQGVDFFTIHAGILRDAVPLATRRKMGIVSRGGALLARWMEYHDRQNPLYEAFDDLCAIAAEYDVCFSLGDGLRPGCLADASDEAQFAELAVLGELVLRCRDAGVQVMVEGPGHIPYDQIPMNMRKQEEICHGAPFYVLGPIVTDAFPGYDHITGAIGATAAAVHGASFLCYVTPTEHLALPGPEEVRAGCVAFKIAAHAADVARGMPGAAEPDNLIADARVAFDWERQFQLAFDGDRAREIRKAAGAPPAEGRSDYCSMCGREFCAMRISAALSGKRVPDTADE